MAKRYFLGLLAVLLLPFTARAVTLAGTPTQSPTGGLTIGFSSGTVLGSHNHPGGTNTLVTVKLYWFDTQSDDVTSVTHCGDAMTESVGEGVINTDGRVEVWYRVAPDTGSCNIVVNTTGNLEEIGSTIEGWTEVNQASPIAATDTDPNSSSNEAQLIATVGANEVLVGGAYSYISAGSYDITPTDTELIDDTGTFSRKVAQYSTDGNMTWNYSVTVDGVFAAGVVLAHDGGGGPSNPAIGSVTPNTFENGDTAIAIAGTDFEASQGAGFVTICTTDDINGTCQAQTVTSWGATAVQFTAVLGGLTLDTNSYLFLENNTGDSNTSGYVVQFLSPPPSITQEGFRWGVDDDSESAHTFEDAQDTNITIDDNQSRLLRVLVDGTGDPASSAFTLRYQINGTGGYAAVPVGSGSTTPPTIEDADGTESGNNTATTSWAVTYPAYVSGDLLVFHIASDANVTHDWPGTGPNGETINTIYDSVGGSTQRASVFWFVGTGTTGSGTLTVTPSATEQWTAAVLLVPAGEFNGAAPIQTNTGTANDTGADTSASTPTWTADAVAGGRVVVWFAIDTVAATAAPGGWELIDTEDRGALGGSLGIRTAANTASESITSADFTIVSETDTSIGYIINGAVITNAVYVATSSNITAGGEATTARLTAPSGKTTGDFVTGRRWDDENGSDSIDITTDDYTEVEWLVALANTFSPSDYVEFRVYAGASPLDTYGFTPSWTIPSGGGGLIYDSRIQRLDRGHGPHVSVQLGGYLQ